MPADIKCSTFKSLSAFSPTAEKCGLLKLKDTRADVVVVAHRLHRPLGGKRAAAASGGTKLVAPMVNTEKSMTVTELWRPHLCTCPLFEVLGLEECRIPTLTTLFVR